MFIELTSVSYLNDEQIKALKKAMGLESPKELMPVSSITLGLIIDFWEKLYTWQSQQTFQEKPLPSLFFSPDRGSLKLKFSLATSPDPNDDGLMPKSVFI